MKPSADEMLDKYGKDKAHANEVKRLSLIISDEVYKKITEISQIEREYLEAASLLHDIGYFIEPQSHNKHSMEMIIKEGLYGFDDREAKIIGCIARYHRGGLPDKHEHEIYGSLEKKDRKIVKRLGGILKLADGLCKEKKDRKIVKRLGGILKLADGLCKDHLNLFKNIEINYDNKNNVAKFILYPLNLKPDIKTAIRKRDLFEIGFKCQSVLLFGE